MSAAAAPAAEASQKKGKMKGILTMLVMAIIFIGAGVGAGIYAAGAGLAGGAHKEEKPVDPSMPQLVTKESPGEDGSHADKQTLPIGLETDKSPDPTKYKATYYTFEQPFTANLRDSDGFAQVGLGA